VVTKFRKMLNFGIVSTQCIRTFHKILINKRHYFSTQTLMIAVPKEINWILCEIRAEYLYIMQINFTFRGFNYLVVIS
jgi:hypothetical protein